jgi:hypothetical protein
MIEELCIKLSSINLTLQIACGLVHAVSLVLYFLELHMIVYQISNGNKNPVDFLNLFLRVASFSYHIIFIFLIWTRSKLFLEVINTMENSIPNFSSGLSQVLSSFV